MKTTFVASPDTLTHIADDATVYDNAGSTPSPIEDMKFAIEDLAEAPDILTRDRVKRDEREQIAGRIEHLLLTATPFLAPAEPLPQSPYEEFARAARNLAIQLDQEFPQITEYQSPGKDFLFRACQTVMFASNHWNAEAVKNPRTAKLLAERDHYGISMSVDDDHDERTKFVDTHQEADNIATATDRLLDNLKKVYMDFTGQPFASNRTHTSKTPDQVAIEHAKQALINGHTHTNADPSMTRRVAVFGGQDYLNRTVVWNILDRLLDKYPSLTIYTGTAKGCEANIRSWCEQRKVHCMAFGPQLDETTRIKLDRRPSVKTEETHPHGQGPIRPQPQDHDGSQPTSSSHLPVQIRTNWKLLDQRSPKARPRLGQSPRRRHRRGREGHQCTKIAAKTA